VIALRPFEPTDDAALISWLRSAAELTLFTGPKLTWPLTSEQLDGIRATPEFAAFTAIVDDEVIGHIELISTGDDSARIGRVLLDPAQRGRGLGEALVRAAIAEASARGIRSLSLFVYPDNTPAVRLYEKLGFTSHGESELLPGSTLMELSLG